MRPVSPDEVLDLIDGPVASTALGAALELGLFWLIDGAPLSGERIAGELGIPQRRCAYWLQVLRETGLVEQGRRGFEPSPAARSAILESYSQESWALLAREARERLPVLRDLPAHIRQPGSAWEAQGLTPPDYVSQMTEDPDRARSFTRMLYELHQPLSEDLAAALDLDGVGRLMDLGGGSGVMSMALLTKNPGLSAVVVDIAAVCEAGREIAAERGLEDRIAYHPGDFLDEELPAGFDLVLECDVNVYGEDLFRRVRESLSQGGRFVIVDQFAPTAEEAPPSRLHWALEGSLRRPDFAFPTAAEVREQLETAGFRPRSERALPASGPCRRFTRDMTVIEALKTDRSRTIGRRE